MKIIGSKGEEILIDDEDYQLLSKHNWYVTPHGYVITDINKKTVYLHKLVVTPLDDSQVDHINRNPLDNRKENLRIATPSQNQMNTVKRQFIKGIPTKSKYKGVHFRKDIMKFVARISVNKRRIHIGVFDKEEDAANAYNELAYIYYGDFAVLNKVEVVL